MKQDNAPAIIVLAQGGMAVAQKIADVTGGVIHAAAKRVTSDSADVLFDDVKAHVQALFLERTPLIAVMASGALVRLLAPVLDDKHEEPPVLVVAEDGTSVIPLLGGHHGANDLAREIYRAHAEVYDWAEARGMPDAWHETRARFGG